MTSASNSRGSVSSVSRVKTASMRLRSRSGASGMTCAYVSRVIRGSRCPSHSATSDTGTPFDRPAEAKKCRSQCGVIYLVMPALALARRQSRSTREYMRMFVRPTLENR